MPFSFLSLDEPTQVSSVAKKAHAIRIVDVILQTYLIAQRHRVDGGSREEKHRARASLSDKRLEGLTLPILAPAVYKWDDYRHDWLFHIRNRRFVTKTEQVRDAPLGPRSLFRGQWRDPGEQRPLLFKQDLQSLARQQHHAL